MNKAGRRGLAVLAAGAAAAPAAAQPAAPHKVVYHLNQPGGENAAYYRQFLVNLANHQGAVQPAPLDMRVVMHARGIDLLYRAAKQDPQIAANIDNLKLAGVKFVICAITLRQNNIRLEELYDASAEDVVPSGVAQLALLQHQGFAYIKI